MREVVRHAEKGTAVLGVCNGFQILCESGLLPGVLLSNAGLKFVCRDVALKVATSQSLFTHRYETGEDVVFPVAHHDGNYFADAETLKRIEDRGQVAFRYADNPNGSANDIAGVFNATKNVLGLMPHPENATDPATAGALGGSTDGLKLFDGIVDALAK
jgi:phosphoribosylformylglycinamidine synthase